MVTSRLNGRAVAELDTSANNDELVTALLDDTDSDTFAAVDGAVETLVEDTTPSLTRAALNNVIAGKQAGLSFAPATDAADVLLDASDPLPLDPIGDYLYGGRGAVLSRTTDPAGAWEEVHDFSTGGSVNGIRDAGDGEVLLSRTGDGIWRSTGWATDPLTATWAQVLVTNAQVTPFGFDVDPASGWAFCTTYIGSGDMSLSRYAWLSTDSGETWTQVYDIEAEHPTWTHTASHLHACVVDPWWNATTPRLWLTYHETSGGPSRIVYSDDTGDTWTVFAADVIQPEAGVATEAGILFDTDTSPMAIYAVRRTAVPADMVLEKVFTLRRASGGMTGFATRAIRGSNGSAHFAFRSTVADEVGAVVTTDGYRAAETVTINPADPTDSVDFTNITIYDDEILGVYRNTATEPTDHRMLTATEPQRGAAPDKAANGLAGGEAGVRSVSAGTGSQALSDQGVAVGSGAKAGLRGTAVGSDADASTGTDALAIGQGASVTATNGIAVGSDSAAVDGVTVGKNASGIANGTALGRSASADGTDATAVGSNATASGDHSTAVGQIAIASGTWATALGRDAVASGPFSLSLGRDSTASHDSSVALGLGAATSAANQVMVGNRDIESTRVGGKITLKSPDGTRYNITVADGGTLTVTEA